MNKVLLIVLCIIAHQAHAQRLRMSAMLQYIYSEQESTLIPMDSSSYVYIGDRGSVDTGGHYEALGYDTRTTYHKDKANGKYRPITWESIDYDSAGRPLLYTYQHYEHKKWINDTRTALRYTDGGDTLSCAIEDYDAKRKT